MRYVDNSKEEAKQLSGMTVKLRNRKTYRIIYGRDNKITHKLDKKTFKGHEFELKFTSNNKKRANREAQKYHRRGFHTRVREMYLGVFSVYRRLKNVE